MVGTFRFALFFLLLLTNYSQASCDGFNSCAQLGSTACATRSGCWWGIQTGFEYLGPRCNDNTCTGCSQIKACSTYNEGVSTCTAQGGCNWTATLPAATIADGVVLGGLRRKGFVESGRTLIDKGTVDIGVLYDRVLLDVHGLDDKLQVFVNGIEGLNVGFNQVHIYEHTKQVSGGPNIIELRHSDRNRGRCWDFGYRIGDKTEWKHRDHFANTSCVRPLGKTWKVMYKIKLKFIFVP